MQFATIMLASRCARYEVMLAAAACEPATATVYDVGVGVGVGDGSSEVPKSP